MSIENTYIIEKSSFLNEIRGNNMSLQTMRFLCIYLSKINARDDSTRCVRFSLADFQKIMNIEKITIRHFKKSVNDLLCNIVHMPTDDGGLSSFQLFKEVKLFKDDSEKWVVEIDAHDEALPLFFNLKGNYFTYELWNALRLKSVNQLRMYELLKQRENLSKFEIKVSELREFLFISSEQYPQMERFKARVLDNCQKALAENTDICFTYECGKRGSRGKWLTIVFHISKNDKHSDPLELNDFIGKQSASQSDCPSDKRLQPTPAGTNGQVSYECASALSSQPYLSGEFEKDIAPADIKVLCDMLACKVSVVSERTSERLEKRLKLLYGHMLVSSKEPIKNACAYLKGVIINIDPNKLPPIPDDDFDVAKYERICINNYEVI